MPTNSLNLPLELLRAIRKLPDSHVIDTLEITTPANDRFHASAAGLRTLIYFPCSETWGHLQEASE